MTRFPARMTVGTHLEDSDATPDARRADNLARRALDPLASAASAIPCYTNAVSGFELSFGALVNELAEQSAAVSSGDLTRPEAMLVRRR